MTPRELPPKKAQIIGAWYESREGVLRGKTGLQVVYRTDFGTAHAGDLRKPWRVPDDVRNTAPLVSKIQNASFEIPKPHPLLVCDDKELSEAFARLVAEPSFAKIGLSEWEFKLAADAPSVYLKWGGFTWKQRKYLREIVKKIVT